jgi:hypothetical protein
MTIRFSRPKPGPDWRRVARDLIPDTAGTATLAGISVAAMGPLGLAATTVAFARDAYRTIRGAVEAARANESVGERAWVWLHSTLTLALVDLIDQQDLASPLDQREKRDAARDFIAGALALEGTEELDLHTLINPALSPAVTPILDHLPELIRRVAPEHRLTDDRLSADFARHLRAASARVYALDPTYYAAIDKALTGPFSEGMRRDLAFARHEDWIRGLYRREPIFSPDADTEIPLSKVYHRLRCYWHTEAQSANALDPQTSPDRDTHGRIAHVADLHETLHAWLRDAPRDDAIRIVAGGPGSGKSSFSRALAVEVADAREMRVLYMQLQHMRLGADLRILIGAHLRDRWHASDPAGGAGFEENPLDWRAWETQPYLLVFDGLDELTHDDDTARDLTRRFVTNVHAMLRGFSGPPVRALILGRSSACQDALQEADLDISRLIHVAPLTPLQPTSFGNVVASPRSVEDPRDLCPRDERPDFWKRSARARGQSPEPVPDAVTAAAMGDLNAEPLLLHLLIVSGYTSANWREAADNRNLVYRAIFEKVVARNRTKRHPAIQNLDDGDVFTLLECLGLAAWRGNGRTGSAADFATLRDLHTTGRQRERFQALPAAELRNVAIQFHTRRDDAGEGFEFIHKSFGEYLAARALLAAGLRAARLMTEGEDPRSPDDVALGWTRLIGAAELTEEVLGFLKNEGRLLTPQQAEASLPPVTRLFEWTLAHGMTAHRVAPDLSYRDIETRQRCAETALLAVRCALLQHIPPAATRAGSDADPPGFKIDWGSDQAAILKLLNRTLVTRQWPARLAIGGMDLRNAYPELEAAQLVGADLAGANLGGAYLDGTNLYGANLSGANLEGALLGGNLSQANLTGAKLDRAEIESFHLSQCRFDEASLRFTTVYRKVPSSLSPDAFDSAFGVRSGIGLTLLPEGINYPQHWHVAEDTDSPEALAAYEAAYQAWLEERRNKPLVPNSE